MKSALTIMMKTCPCLLLLVLFLGCAGALNGQGTYTYPSGNVYTGNFADNKRQGQGTLKFASG